MSPEHSRGGRRPRIVFIEPAETQVRVLTTKQTGRLDAALNVIAADPTDVKPHATTSALRDYQHDGLRVIFYATALGTLGASSSSPTSKPTGPLPRARPGRNVCVNLSVTAGVGM
ncbi:hypothetical protein ACF064_34630 [Streptomyces sp. NPDC015492]|uniref:hypothetical protein n=1 Tax=Streptomyces sp. NPDC015492 TaxID=3364958 RepID=UPI0036F846FD